MRTRPLVLCLAVAFSLVSVVARAQWQSNGALVCGAANDQIAPRAVPDGAGGAIITWYDYRNGGNNDIYAQRVNSSGVPQWTANGVAICTAIFDQTAPEIASDGAGGAVITWYDYRANNADIYVQRVNAAGVPQWAPNGVTLCTDPNFQVFTDIASDGAGGAIVTWQDDRNGTDADVYVRRVNSAGVPQWAANGVAACALPQNQDNPKIASDGAGGAIVAWGDGRVATGYDVYAQRFNASGAPQWAANGAQMCGATDNQYNVRIVADGAGGAVIAWADYRPGLAADVYAQRVNAAGTVLWTADGVAVCTATNDQTGVALIPDGSGGALFTWNDSRNVSDDDIYATRVNGAGVPQWIVDGVALCSAGGYQDSPRISSDGAGGAIVVWDDGRNSDSDVYGQRVNPFGIVEWTAGGEALCTSPGSQTFYTMVSDGAGAAIAAWYDRRSVAWDIYAQRVEPRFGVWGRPEPIITSVADIRNDQGGRVAVNWTASARDLPNPRTIGHYSIWRAVNALPFNASTGTVVALRAIKSVGFDTRGPVFAPAAPTADYYWELVGTQSAHGWAGYSFSAETRADSVAGNVGNEFFMVAAHDTYEDYMAFSSNAVSGHSVDNLAPAAPLLLTIQQTGPNAALNWKPATDSDVARYTLYRKNSAGVQPVPNNFLIDEALPSHTDVGAAAGGFFYVVTATDIHGNQSAPSNEVSLSGSTGTGDTPPITALMVLQNSPNPFSTSAEFNLGLPRDADVTLEIYDIAGRRVASREMGVMEKGWRKVALDARDSAGHALPSGVYFYRVKAAGATLTRKMVIAR